MIKTKKLTCLLVSTIPFAGSYTAAHAQALVIKDNEHRIVDEYLDLGVRATVIVGRGTDGELTVKDDGHFKISLINIGTEGADGVVNVVNGGQLQINNDNSFSYPLAIGGRGETNSLAQGSTGILNIIGSGSKVYRDDTSRYGGEISVGSSGAHGILNIKEGGQLIISSTQGDGIWIGSRGGDTTKGVVNVDGDGSLMYSNGRILVGTYNEGQLHVTNGGKVQTDSYISVGRAVTDNTIDNVLSVSGASSHVESSSYVEIGYIGKGTVIVADDGKLTATKITVASRAGMTGELAIGSRAGEAATAAGIIDTALVEFGQGNGRVVFNHTNTNYGFASAITGNGKVDFLSGTTILTGANTYNGPTTVDAGATLRAGASNTFSAASDYTVLAAGRVDLNGYDQTMKSLTNAGTLYFGPNAASAGSQLFITGDYTGQNGTIIMNAALGNDTSLTDMLNIAGNATGTTYVEVNNLGGAGDDTVEGLKIIHVGGTSDNNAFEQQGRIVAGAYDYQLVKGDVSQTDPESWYLTSMYALTLGPDGDAHIMRPEGGAYLSNLAAANTLFNLRLHDRQGEQTTYLISDDSADAVLPWVRFNYKHENFEDQSEQLKTKGHSNIIQVGTDLFQFGSSTTGLVNVGVMGGYGQYSGDTRNDLKNYTASSKLKGYHAGVYGTWYASPAQEGGAYVDTWLMWNHFNADVNGEGQRQESYHLKGLSASVEAGYAMKAGQFGGYNLWIEPQAQLIWMGVKADDHTEVNRTRVTGEGENLQTRAGARFYVSKQEGNTQTVMPYVEANWIHNTKPFNVEMDGASVRQGNTRNIAEFKAGVQTKLGSNTSLWVDVGHQSGFDTYKNTQLRFGLKHTF